MGIRVAVAMSGGVDSSVACLLLKEKGYDVVGLTMKLLPNSPSDELVSHAPCCTLEMAEDARRICQSLGVPHYTVNLVEEFEQAVIVPFIRDYTAGRTPNPCLVCNTTMKFGHLLQRAREIGATYVATGHYARSGRRVDGKWIDNVESIGNADSVGTVDAADRASPDEFRTLLLRGVDRTKDQSYALYGLTQDELSHAMFPLGGLTKKEVRKIARDAGLKTADKPESQEICFVPGSYREFLAGRGIEPQPGPILDTSGNVVGRHLGIPFYTVGQRRGLGLAEGEPMYVVDLDLANNAVVVGKRSEAYASACTVEDLNLISTPSLGGPVKGTCMVRYRGKESPATLSPVGPLSGAAGTARVDFDTPQFAVTPGQAAVLYQGEVVFGGGTIAGRSPEGA